MSWIKAALLLLQIVRQIMDYLERSAAVQEGERRQVAQQLAAIAAAAQIAKETQEEISRLTDAEIDDALRGDFRD